jgi:hypothetical protein
MQRAEVERFIGRPSHLRAVMLAHVAIADIAWLVILVPLGLLFQILLVLARGYYACRRQGRILGAFYAAAVVSGFGWLVWLLWTRGPEG